MNFTFWHENKEFRLHLEEKGANDILVSLGKKTYRVSVEFLGPDEVLLNIDGKVPHVIINSNSFSYPAYVGGKFFNIDKKSDSQPLGKKGTRFKK
ncbi:MAG: hypothetical protein GQ536_08320, partial [Candidatus Aminicenantes bacterium]|nr:hypothetical protein [Candidatus Aminicenantes bacterium]